MPADRSRSTDRARHGYTGVVAQQGRVILDRDFNAQQGLTADRIAADALDFVGPCGTPDDGFRISATGASPPAPPFWSPPVAVPSSPPETPGGAGDFLIAPGTMYLGGQRVHWPGEQSGGPITYSYFDQPDWPVPPPPGASPQHELVYLDVTEQEVSAVEDPDLLEVALGGPDTTQRLKLLRRVRRLAVPDTTCADAWQTARDQWAAQGLRFDPATMRLLPQARLQIGLTGTQTDPNLCDPIATGGYLGTENQLIRLLIARAGAQTRLIWGYDNATFIYRVDTVSADFTTLTLTAGPPDGFHIPQTGQIVEVLRTAAVIGEEPDETDPTGQAQIPRVAADPRGDLRQLRQPYGPVPGITGNAIVLTEPLPSDIQSGGLPLFLRVWQAALDISPGGGTVPLQQLLTDPITGVSSTVIDTGLGATLSVPAGGTLAEGAFWQIAVRPSTPQFVYPEALLTDPQPPDGPRRWVCPLAVLDWSAGSPPSVTDCRSVFDNLVTLTRRKPGCCTVSIGKADLTATTSLQILIDRAAAQADIVTVCLAAGDYPLTGSLTLDQRHNGLTLESCGGPAVLHAVDKPDPAAFADGLVVIDQASKVTLRGLTLVSPATLSQKLLRALEQRIKAAGVQAGKLPSREATTFGVRAVNASSLTLENCGITLGAPASEQTGLFGAAVFLQGNCAGLTVRGCTFSAASTPTYTSIPTPTARSVTPAARTLRAAMTALATAFAPPGSADVTATIQDTRLNAALAVLIAKQAETPAGAAPAAFVATVGVLALDYQGASDKDPTMLACALGAASVRDTAFHGLTFAAWISATATTIRLQDNTITDGVAGLWLETPGAGTPQNPAKGTERFYPSIQYFLEFIVLFVSGAMVPPPSTQPAAQKVSTKAADLALFVIGNQVQTQVTGGDTAALFLSLNQPRIWDAADATLSVVISANRLRNAAGNAAPAALVVLPRQQTCAITGNTVLNLETRLKEPVFGPSLWVIAEGSADGTEWFSAAGNALRGASDLHFIDRPGASTRAGWSAFNADQT